MQSPEEELLNGAAILGQLLEQHGFAFAPVSSGQGSGGHFASGEFVRGNRTLSFSVRYGLGLVEYRLGQSSIGHEDFLRYSGVWGKHSYPNFGGTVAESFAALRSDIETHLRAFLQSTDSEFLTILRARNSEPSKYRGFSALKRDQ